MRSERVNLLVTPEEKAAIEAQAAALNLSTSEMVRRAVASYDPEFDESELQALADELSLVVAATEESLDTALRQFDALGAFLADKASLRRAARAELEAEGVVAFCCLSFRRSTNAELREPLRALDPVCASRLLLVRGCRSR